MKTFLTSVFLVAIAAFAAMPSRAQSGAPAVYYLDILSGPNTGGANNNGVDLTISGNNFGATQGSSTVTIGGGAAASYLTWSNTRIQVAIGSQAKSGPVVVTVGSPSLCVNHDDGCSFTVRSGNIYYVGPSGSDSGAGSFSAPWATLKHADATIKPGDTVYALNGFSVPVCDGAGLHANFTLNTSGTSSAPIAYVAYPGATATIGTLAGSSCGGDTSQYSVRSQNNVSYTTVAGFVLLNPQSALEWEAGATNVRLINLNYETANAGNGSSLASFETMNSSYIYAYGNYGHDFGGTNKLNSAMYFTSNTNHIWVGWNTIGAGNSTNHAMLEVHSTSGNDQYDIHVHDNLIENGAGDCMILTTVDPSQGPVEVYNNIFYHCGTGPNTTSSSTWHYDAISMTGEVDAGSAPSGTVQIYNNTFYDYGSSGNQGFGATFGAIYLINQSSPALSYQFTNNIFASNGSSEPYFTADSTMSLISGCSNNVFYASGGAPSSCGTAAVTSNPLLASAASQNFSLQSGSPAAGAGSSSHMSTFDFSGAPRPSPPAIGAYDIGGALVSGGSPAPPPPAPTNLSVVVQ